MRRTIQQALCIAGLGMALGMVANVVSPRRLPWITPPPPAITDNDWITLPDATNLWSTGVAFFLDARAPADYEAGHIPNAFNVPAEEFDAHYTAVATMLTPATPIVAYCDGVECTLSHDLTERLRQLGYTNVRILKNGWTVWREAGLITTTGAQP